MLDVLHEDDERRVINKIKKEKGRENEGKIKSRGREKKRQFVLRSKRFKLISIEK